VVTPGEHPDGLLGAGLVRGPWPHLNQPMTVVDHLWIHRMVGDECIQLSNGLVIDGGHAVVVSPLSRCRQGGIGRKIVGVLDLVG